MFALCSNLRPFCGRSQKTLYQSVSPVTVFLCFVQAHGAVELSTYCEGYFLQNMAGLLEREAFRTIILGSGTRSGSGKDALLEELEATLARRLRSLLVTSRV